ncbi:MAG: hypothetical protein IRY83_04435 [Chloroflexi bacterium]|nr:hypothetical protein [Chloroflexota bacterium]
MSAQPGPGQSPETSPEQGGNGGAGPPPGPGELPEPALGRAGHGVVQVNVEEDMPFDGGGTAVNETATVVYGVSGRRTIAMVAVAVVVAVVLAFPVIWVLVEMVALAGLIGPWTWAWAVLLVVLVAAAVFLGIHLAREGL